MRALSAPELLAAWERAMDQPSTHRALILLGAACPDASPEELAQLTIGERDARLLMLREWTFGPQLTSFSNCAACGERLELSFKASDVRTISEMEQPHHPEMAVDRYEIGFRLPNSFDLIAAAAAGEVGSARAVILNRCVLSARHSGREVSAGDLPENVINAIAARMNELDPQADIQLALKCPACANECNAQFDVESFFWAEIGAWATRIINEIHVLASAYGWREADILGMSAWRRQCYLKLVSG
jgi:hypothetical protein